MLHPIMQPVRFPYSFYEATLEEVAAELGVTVKTAREIEQRALWKMRRAFQRRRIQKIDAIGTDNRPCEIQLSDQTHLE